MKYLGGLVLALAFFSIMVEGTYSRSEIVDVTLQLVPSPTARPELVEQSLSDYSGVKMVHLDRAASRIDVRYDKARISLADLEHLLISLGYQAITRLARPATQASF